MMLFKRKAFFERKQVERFIFRSREPKPTPKGRAPARPNPFKKEDPRLSSPERSRSPPIFSEDRIKEWRMKIPDGARPVAKAVHFDMDSWAQKRT